MANASLYLDSMRELSVALEKAMALTQNRLEVKTEFERIQSTPENDSKMIWNTVLDAMPKITRLREAETSIQKDYLERLRNSVRIVLEYLLMLEESDLTGASNDGPQKHLQLLYEVIISRYTNDEERVDVDRGLAEQVLDKLDSYSQQQNAIIIKELVNKILENCNYVG